MMAASLRGLLLLLLVTVLAVGAQRGPPRPPPGQSGKPPRPTNKCRASGCTYLVECAPFFSSRLQTCTMSGGSTGVACPKLPVTGPSSPIGRQPPPPFKRPNVSQANINNAIQHAHRPRKNRARRTRTLNASNRPGTPENRHQMFTAATPAARARGVNGNHIIGASQYLKDQLQLSATQAGIGLQLYNLNDAGYGDECVPDPVCDNLAIYRSIDGSCNNVNNPKWGMLNTQLRRMMTPAYDDGVYEPRGGSDNPTLPSARKVSSTATLDMDAPLSDLTLLVMQMAQFVDHNIVHTPINSNDDGSGIECCSADGQILDPSELDDACFPIEIPADDPFYSQFGRRCMNNVRSLPVPNENCTFGFGEQINQLTHFLDGSAIYSSTEEEVEELRSHTEGKLVSQGSLLPAFSDVACDGSTDGEACFVAGDARVNEQPELAAVHTLWLLEHNRIATELAAMNPTWDDEKLFQETRRIVVATLQHIVYNEWLPIILGDDNTARRGLVPQQCGHFLGYDARVNPAISNEFATAAYRFGHSMVQGFMELMDQNYQVTERLELSDHFFNTNYLYRTGKVDEMLRGLCKQPIQNVDSLVSTQLTNHLFQSATEDYGMDLIALNIQRGRDHGIPSYTEVRKLCGLPTIRNWAKMEKFVPTKAVNLMRSVYSKVEDVDLFVAGMSEKHVPTSLLGPTFHCIIGDQFLRLKIGDRFFYENGGLPSSFTTAQLDAIRRSSYSRLMCNNVPSLTQVQLLPMRAATASNPRVSCGSSRIPVLDLAPWKV